MPLSCSAVGMELHFPDSPASWGPYGRLERRQGEARVILPRLLPLAVSVSTCVAVRFCNGLQGPTLLV